MLSIDLISFANNHIRLDEQLFFLAAKKQQPKIKIGHSRQKSYTPGTTLHRRKPNKRRNHKEEFKSSLIKDPEFQEEYLKMLKTKIKSVKRQDSGNNENKSKGYNIQKFEYKDQ